MTNFLKKLSLVPDKNDIKSLIISFLIINFTYLYHTLNFMWGNHDVKFIKEELLLSSGLFEGRFTQFIPYRLLTNGQILPILNNLIGFCFLSLAIWLLAKYWELKKSKLNYILTITFFATLPYTLSWLYFTFITISCLAWTFFAILGLYLSAKIPNHKNKYLLSILSILCFYLPLGGYPPIINTFAVCLMGKLIIEVLFNNKTLKQLFSKYKYTLLNILIATILFKLSLYIFSPNDVYNLETTPINALPQKLISTIKISFEQFFISVPFMEKGYKLTLAIMCLIGLIGAFFTPSTLQQRLKLLVLFFGIIFATSLTTLLVVPPTELVSRIDFYGIAFLYTFFLVLLLKLKPNLFESLGIIFGFVIIFFNILNDIHALKVWKQGFDAEFRILDEVIDRIENHPSFTQNKKYRFYQAGDISLRPSYYKGNFQKDDVFLHSLPYLAMWQGENLVQFYTQKDYLQTPSIITPSDITDEVFNFVMTKASPWPSENSIFINNNIIIIFYDQYGLDDFKSKLRQLRP